MRRGVRVVGIGVRTPFGIGAERLLSGLCAGRSPIAQCSQFVQAGLRFPVAATVPDEARLHGVTLRTDRAAALLEGAVRDALSDATGVDAVAALGVSHPARVALVAGTSSSGIGAFCAGLADPAAVDPSRARYASAAHAVASLMQIEGPVIVVCSVCASGAIAIAEAVSLLEDDVVDVAIAAGFDPIEPFVGAGFDALGALTDSPRPFRAGRRGLVLGEGAAALVLTREERSRPCVGRVLGVGGSADAHHLTAPDPQGRGVALAIERALQHAGLSRDDVGVINAHGTGTPFNDAMECAALTRVFGPRGGERPVYTVKGTIGHTLGAAGAIEAVVSLVAMNAHVIPPTITSGEPDPRCDVALVADVPERSAATVTLSLSSAFGGANCALLLGAGDAS